MIFKDYEFATDIKMSSEERINKSKVKIQPKDNKNKKCLLCGKDLTGQAYCNSHSIPHFILDKLQPKGSMLNLNSILNNDFLGKREVGKNNALTFHSICRECDGTFFNLYENPDLYLKLFTINDVNQDLLYLIKLKNVLYEMYYDNYIIGYAKELSKYGNKRIQDAIGIYNRFGNIIGYRNQLNLIKYKNEQEYWRHSAFNQLQYKKHVIKKITEKFDYLLQNKGNKNNKRLFKVGYFARLDYKIGFAFQRDLTLITDTKWDVINNVYIENDDYDFASFLVFPFDAFSIIIIFVENSCTRYDNYFKQLNSMKLEEQLKRIVFDIFVLSEHILLNDDITPRQLDSLKDLVKTNDLAEKPTIKNRVETLKKLYNKKFYYFYKK